MYVYDLVYYGIHSMLELNHTQMLQHTVYAVVKVILEYDMCMTF